MKIRDGKGQLIKESIIDHYERILAKNSKLSTNLG